MNLYLIGYRGTGKSTVTRLVAAELGQTWEDADALLEHAAGKNIREIFAEEGEAGFRRRESDILLALSTRVNTIVATGGGVILSEANRSLLKQGFVVWLQASPEAIWQRLQEDDATAARRPNLAGGGLEEIRTLLAQRTALYEACAHLCIDTNGLSPEQVADLVVHAARNTKK